MPEDTPEIQKQMTPETQKPQSPDTSKDIRPSEAVPPVTATPKTESLPKSVDEMTPKEVTKETEDRGEKPVEDGSREPSFTEKLDGLLKTTEGEKAEISDPRLRAVATLARAAKTEQRLGELLQKVDNFLEGESENPDFVDQMAKLAGVLDEERDKLRKTTTPSSSASTSKEMIDKLSEIAEGVRASTKTLKESGRVQEKSRKIMTGEETEVIPASKEDQRKKFIQLIEVIELNEKPLTDYNNALIANRILRAIESPKIDPELKEECLARLKLHHCAIIAGSIPGSTEHAASHLLNAFGSPESRKYALEGEDFECLFKHKLDGLKVAQAFDLLQRANVLGIEIEGKVLRLSSNELSAPEERAVQRELERRLGGGQEALTSLKLAKRIAQATLETSVWNRNFVGNDPLAEAIHFKKYRLGRLARDKGPEVTIPYIEGFGTSFFRSAQTTEQEEIRGTRVNIPLFLSGPENNLRNITGILNTKERTSRMLRRNRGENLEFDEKNPLEGTVALINPEAMNFPRIRPGEYMSWLGVNVTRTLAFKELLLQSTWKPEDFGEDKIDKYVSPANAADPQQALRLRSWFVLGAFWVTYSRSAPNIVWDNFTLHDVKDKLTRRVSTVAGETPPFLTKEQMEWVLKNLKDSFDMNIHEKARRVGVQRLFSDRFLGRRG